MNEEFEDPRLAAVYDALDPDRSDLEPYLAYASRVGAARVLDVGCGTGVFALLLAARGFEVIGVDPAVASLDVARAKEGAEAVRWLEGDASVLAGHGVGGCDLATMTANVAMVLLTDDDARATLQAIADALRPGGHVAFETRRPDARAWENWTYERTWREIELDGGSRVASWVDVAAVRWPLLEIENTVAFRGDETIVSRSTLRYRELVEWCSVLDDAGFEVVETGDAPDRPGREWVVLAKSRVTGGTSGLP